MYFLVQLRVSYRFQEKNTPKATIKTTLRVFYGISNSDFNYSSVNYFCGFLLLVVHALDAARALDIRACCFLIKCPALSPPASKN